MAMLLVFLVLAAALDIAGMDLDNKEVRESHIIPFIHTLYTLYSRICTFTYPSYMYIHHIYT